MTVNSPQGMPEMSSRQSVHSSFREFGKRPTTSQAIIDKVEDFVRKDLEGRFKNGFVFDPIIVNPELDHYGDEFLHIYIIFEGEQKGLDPRWTNGIEDRLLMQLPMGELPNTPGHSFISKSEWKKIYREQIR